MIVCTPGQDAIVIEWCFTSLQEVLVEKLVLGKKNQPVTITKISFHKIKLLQKFRTTQKKLDTLFLEGKNKVTLYSVKLGNITCNVQLTS